MTNLDANNQNKALPIVTKDQASGITERLLYAGATAVAMKLVSHGWISADDATWVATGIIGAVGGAYAWWVTKPSNILLAASNLKGTTVVTTPDLAAATPSAANIISNTETQATIQATVKENK